MDRNIVTEQPKHTEAVLGAVERTLGSHDLRLRPGQTIEDVAEALAAHQVQLSESNGYLNASMGGLPVHLNTVVEALAVKEAARFFPRDVTGVASRDELDMAGKVKFIREQGIEAFEKLPQTAPTQRTVVLDVRRLKRDDYLALDRSTRAQLAAEWGPEGIGAVMARRK